MSITLYHNTPYLAPLFLAAEESEEEGRIFVEISPAILRQSEVNQWFFLQQELKGPMRGGTFVLSLNMKMELAIRPDLIYRFKGLLSEWEDPINMLQALAWEASQPGATEPDVLIKVDSWLCLGVEQQHPGGKTGFRTLWDEVLPQMQARGIGPKDLDFTHMEVRLKRGEEDDVPDIDIQFEESGQIFATWPVKDNPRMTPGTPIEEETNSAPPLGLLGSFGRMLDGKEIRYSLIGKDGLRFFHAGKKGRWSCEAKVWEDKRTIAMYSLFPVQASQNHQESLSSWINQTNQALPVGTFALDSDSGDLRFRTSASFHSHAGLDSNLQSLWQENISIFDAHYQEILQLISPE